MRGLKLSFTYSPLSYTSRIFYRCVDWNRKKSQKDSLLIWSHLLQMRGLKPSRRKAIKPSSSRIFYRCVDWNHGRRCSIWKNRVASFTDAWIETFWIDLARESILSHLLQMRGLKHYSVVRQKTDRCRIFYRCVDWNWTMYIRGDPKLCRIFYRCVDWNKRPF